MLEIDGVRAALSMAPQPLRVSMDSAADDYLNAIDRTTNPGELPDSQSEVRDIKVLTTVNFLREHADVIMPVLQRQEDTPGLHGVSRAYTSVLSQLEAMAGTHS